MRILVVGGGVLGTMHAWQAVHRGHDVVQIEREQDARGASVRNFGLVWVSGRSVGAELESALRARELWAEIGAAVPKVGFRPNGSLTMLTTAEEVAVAEELLTRPDAASRRVKLLTRKEVLAVNPAVRGDYLAGLLSEADGAVEPRTAQRALREALLATGRYTWLPGREIRAVDTGRVRDDHGDVHTGDRVVLCLGAALSGLCKEIAGEIPVRRVRLQMLQTEPFEQRLTTSVADGDSLRYYPAYAGDALDRLCEAQPQEPVAAEHKMQLLAVQRADGGLTIGDTHAYAEPFDFDVVEPPYEHVAGVLESLLGQALPPIKHRWAGVYAQTLDSSKIVHRDEPVEGVHLVMGPGGRGMTCSPAIAERTFEELGL